MTKSERELEIMGSYGIKIIKFYHIKLFIKKFLGEKICRKN